MGKIGLGIHLDSSVLPQVYLNHLSTISIWAKDYDLTILGLYRVKVASARNKIVEAAIKENLDHVLFIDSDHLIPENMLRLLLENADAAMVSGLICKRAYPYETVAFVFSNEDNLQLVNIYARDKVLKVDGCAMGCTLINIEQLKLLKKPYFYDNERRSDLNLCVDFRKIGKDVLLDSRVSLGHLGEPPVVYPDNADELRVKVLNDIRKEDE